MIFTWQSKAWEEWIRLRERLPHALLVHAGEGMGAKEFALELAQALLCESRRGDGQACGACPACNWFGQGNHPDFRLVQPESMAPDSPDDEPRKEKRSEQIRIEQVRALADFLAVGTHRGGLRVIVVAPAEAMNPNTQNALLKSLEEPPAGTLFVLVASQPERLLPTVRSRCSRFSLPLPDRERALLWLKSRGVDEPGAALAAAGGAPMAALEMTQREDERKRFLDRLHDPAFDPIAVAELSQHVAPLEFVTWLQRWSHDLLLCRVSGKLRYHPEDEGVIVALSRRCRAVDIAAYLRQLARARALAGHPLNAKLFLEDLLLQYRRLIAQT